MSSSINILLKEYLEKKEYELYNEVLIKEISSIFVKKIKEKNKYFLYSNLVELQDSAFVYLNVNLANICRQFYFITREYDSLKLSEKLMEIYEIIKDK